MPEVKTLAKFDASQPVYCVKAFFYGVNNSSIRHASDHPLRLDQIPVKYRTEEYIRQGKITSTIPRMIAPEVKPEGMKFDVPETSVVNPLAIPIDKDEAGNILPQSTPESVRKATRNKARAKKEEAAASTGKTSKQGQT